MNHTEHNHPNAKNPHIHGSPLAMTPSWDLVEPPWPTAAQPAAKMAPTLPDEAAVIAPLVVTRPRDPMNSPRTIAARPAYRESLLPFWEGGNRVTTQWYPVTDAGTLSAHLVSEDALTAGRRAGRFRAACGDVVLAASLTAQERDHCLLCVRQRERGQR